MCEQFLTKWAYISYHARPFYIIKHLLKLCSLSEFKRKFFAFLDIIFSQEKLAREDTNFRAFNENKKRYIEKCRSELDQIIGDNEAR